MVPDITKNYTIELPAGFTTAPRTSQEVSGVYGPGTSAYLHIRYLADIQIESGRRLTNLEPLDLQLRLDAMDVSGRRLSL